MRYISEENKLLSKISTKNDQNKDIDEECSVCLENYNRNVSGIARLFDCLCSIPIPNERYATSLRRNKQTIHWNILYTYDGSALKLQLHVYYSPTYKNELCYITGQV